VWLGVASEDGLNHVVLSFSGCMGSGYRMDFFSSIDYGAGWATDWLGLQ